MTPHAPDLIRRFDFERWPRPAAGEVKVFIWRLTIGPELLNDWEQVRVQVAPLPHDCRYTTSIWKPKTSEGLLRLDIYEEPSRQAAELRLLDLLAGFQSPLVPRDAGAKYPLFRYGNDTTLAFTRGNLTFFVANAERKLVSLKNILAKIDRLFSLGPAQPAPAFIPVLKLAEYAHVRVKAAVPLTLETAYPLPLWFRIETKLGEVLHDDSRLMYEAASAGAETLHVTAIGTDGHVTRVERNFTVSDAK